MLIFTHGYKLCNGWNHLLHSKLMLVTLFIDRENVPLQRAVFEFFRKVWPYPICARLYRTKTTLLSHLDIWSSQPYPRICQQQLCFHSKATCHAFVPTTTSFHTLWSFPVIYSAQQPRCCWCCLQHCRRSLTTTFLPYMLPIMHVSCN